MVRPTRAALLAVLTLLATGTLGTAIARSDELAQSTPSGGQPIARPTPVPDVPSVGPDIYSSRPAPGVQKTAPMPSTPPVQYAPAPNVGPTTGYGPGGMAPVPGAPANPPYSFGGTSGQPR